MRFADFKANAEVCKMLSGMVSSGRIPGALMFHEDDGGGAVPLAMAFLQYLGCTNRQGEDSCGECPSCNKISKLIHPDIHFVFPVTGGSIIPSSAKPTSLSYIKQWRDLVLSNPWFSERDLEEALGIEGKSPLISVADAKEILSQIAFNPLEGNFCAVVVYLPEKMNADAANRLLKSLEEPPAKTIFILITHSPEKVLPTVASRCQLVRVSSAGRPIGDGGEENALNRELFVSLMDAVVSRDLASALEAGEAVASLPSRDRIKSFLSYLSEMMRVIFLASQGLSSIAHVHQEDMSAAASYAPSLKKSYPRSLLPVIDRASMMIDRNVNQKIVLCDLVDKMFMI